MGQKSLTLNTATGKERYAEKTDAIKFYGTWGAISLVAATGIFFGVRYLVREVKQDSAANDSLNPGAASNYASRLKMAFDNDMWWGMGTDEELIYTVFREIPSKAVYDDVIKAYSNLYKGANLNTDLQDELDTSEYQKVVEILNSKS